MVPELDTYLKAHTADFKSAIDTSFSLAKKEKTFTPNYMLFLEALTKTAFYTGIWEREGFPRWWNPPRNAAFLNEA